MSDFESGPSTLGERLDRIVYISHLDAVNGEGGYENELNEIEDVIVAIERHIFPGGLS